MSSTITYVYRQDPAEPDAKPFVPGFGWAPLGRVFRAPVTEEGDARTLFTLSEAQSTDKRICETLYMRHNLDDRPRAREIRSMSVGDLVSITRDGVTRHYACAPIGWLEVHEETDRLLSVRQLEERAATQMGDEFRRVLERAL